MLGEAPAGIYAAAPKHGDMPMGSTGTIELRFYLM